ncbi:phosphatidate cytidylyltransferase [Aquiluna borgnonia]|uniref:Phosphatidate cytidylyltransferase n=1 Tax=Aquiluna borgnonia TaxID=2499157 RepID=A0A7D4PQE6_9MICO|nr:phosphatidate cytidylyltransferase [Aquiluna borgnonia]QKJ25086.1 phosphatidate cytidylyltransferase [Aquiluna borgnonia]
MESAKTKTLGPRLAVGFGLGGIFLLSLISPYTVVGLVSVAAAAAGFELSTALRSAGWHVPRIPVAIAGLAVPWMAFLYGPTWQWLTVFAAIVLMVAWRTVYLIWNRKQQPLKNTLRDFGASAWAVFYVPLLMSFAALLVTQENGIAFVFGLTLTVVSIDTFGYLVGRFFGKTKLSPAISPKKTWEGLFASIAGGIFGGIVTALVTGNSIWFGLIWGSAILVSSVMGDLSESLIKRDLEVKDMGDLLPGHGGVMDRLDSLLPSLFVGYLLSHVVF